MSSILGVRMQEARLVARLSRWALATSVFSLLASAGTFGTVVPIGGHASDIALDEARSVVYVANFTANRIDVVSTKTLQWKTSIAVAVQPASLALSPDGKYLVVTHVSNFDPTTGGTPYNGLTVISGLDAGGNQKQTFAFGSPPLGVAFGNDGLALVVTTTEFDLFDPVTGYIATLGTIADVTTKTLPVDVGQYPRDIIRASVTASGDRSRIFGTLEYSDSASSDFEFRYDVAVKEIAAAYWISAPPLGPRVVSVDQTGSVFASGWVLMHADGYELAQFPNAVGTFSMGSLAIDTARKTVYAQLSMSSTFQVWPPNPTPYTGPVLMVTDSDNLAVREQLMLPQNLAGRSILSADGNTMYSVSDSGLMILPVGQLYVQSGSKVNQVVASQESLLFSGNWCDRTIHTQTLTISDPGGGKTDFALSTDLPGVILTPSSGTTPATVKVSVDPNTYQNVKGTMAGLITISSGLAANVPVPVQLLVSNPEPDQRGSIYNVPGKLVSVLADPVRNRFYVLRQDKNQVLVFDAASYKQIGTLRTGNTPWSMAITFDKRYLLIGADNSQVVPVYDLDTWQFQKYIVMPGGHYPRWIAVSGRAILAACRVAGPVHTVDRLQLWGVATAYPSLGIFKNDINIDTALSASSSGSSILVAMADGRTMLYDANTDTFVAARKDFAALTGPVAAISDEDFVVGDHVLDASLAPYGTLETGNGISSGFAMVDGLGLRTLAPDSSSPGVIERVDLSLLPFLVRPTRMSEAPLLADATVSNFLRTLAPLANRNAIVSLSTSGFTVLSWNYDVATASPTISSVVNAADQTTSVAPGGLISVLGQNLSAVNAATNQIPLPTALANSCLTVNGVLVPMIMVSPTQINGQLPVDVSGRGTMVLRTPAGVSNTFYFPILDVAPATFSADVAGWDVRIPTVTHADGAFVTPSYPIHPKDNEWIVIYLTGMGLTLPGVDSGAAGPSDPLAQAIVMPKVTLGGAELAIGYAGLVPGEVGVYQINALVPFKGVPAGMEVPLTITQDGSSTTVTVRVVN